MQRGNKCNVKNQQVRAGNHFHTGMHDACMHAARLTQERLHPVVHPCRQVLVLLISRGAPLAIDVAPNLPRRLENDRAVSHHLCAHLLVNQNVEQRLHGGANANAARCAGGNRAANAGDQRSHTLAEKGGADPLCERARVLVLREGIAERERTQVHTVL